MDVGEALLIRPTSPKVIKIIQEATKDADSKMVGVEKEVIDKESDDFFEYQEEMIRYVSDKTRYKRDIQNCFNAILGQCSPAVLQDLQSEDTYNNINIGLIQLIEKLCYDHKPHEYTQLGARSALDKLTSLEQPKTIHEVKHYETFKSVVEMCKASKVNFATMCTENIDTSLVALRKDSKITTTGLYKYCA